VFGGVFVAIERHVAHPMLDLRLFAGRTFAGAAAGVFVMSASVPAVLVYLVLYLEQVLGQGPLAVGLELLPFAALSFAAAPVSGRLIAVVGDRVLIVAGLVAAAAGLLSMRAAAAGSAWTVLLPGLVLLGLAQGLINPPVTNAAVSSVAPERAGMASGANSTARQLGVACGIAGLGAVFRAVASSHAAPAAAIDGLHALLLVAAGLAGAGALTCAFLLPGRPAAGAARLARFRPQPKEPCHDHVDCL
jgi:predicted MFS family arabinose efflux permease